MLKLFYFFRGYLLIRVSGASAERFLNLCGIRHMMLWNIQKEDTSYTMFISLKSFFQLREIVHKTATRVVVLKRIGLPFFMKRVKKRWFFPAFVFLSVMIFSVSQFLLWNIRIEGNLEIDKEEILAFLEEYEIEKGMPKREINAEELEKEIRKTFPEITWVSVYLDGNSLVVSLKENDKIIPEEKEEEKQHKEGFLEEEKSIDICATKAGKVTSIVTRAGTPAVKPGDEVVVGDVLIRGIVEIYDNEGNVRENVLVHADGDIMIEGTIQTFFETPAVKIIETESGNVKHYTYFRCGDSYRILKLFQVPYEEFRAQPIAYVEAGKELGIRLEAGEMEIKEIQKTEEKKAEAEYQQELQAEMEEYIITLKEKAIQITGKNVKIKKNMDFIRMEVTFRVKGPFYEKTEAKPIPEDLETSHE